MIPVHSRAVSILPSGSKKNGNRFGYYFAVDLVIILQRWGCDRIPCIPMAYAYDTWYNTTAE